MYVPGLDRAWPAREPKFTSTPKPPICTFSLPDARFSHVHVDLVDSLPLSLGQRYLLTCVDRFTRWSVAISLHWVASFGFPRYITTDRGRQFKSSTFRGLCEFLGFSSLRTTANHPAANGLGERFHGHLKGTLRAQSNPDRWVENLPLVQLGCHAAVKSDLKCSAADLVYGKALRLLGEFFSPVALPSIPNQPDLLSRVRDHVRDTRPTPPPSTAPSEFSSGPTVGSQITQSVRAEAQTFRK